jgi:hypothetical protein
MLRHGLSTYDFSRIANIAFVQAARDILQEQGKPLSFSRVSTITGLHRHVVSEIVNSGSDVSPGSTRDKDYRRNRLARVLSGWFESPTYTDSDGRPRLLQFDGPAPSFTSLVHDFSGDIYPRIILEVLQEVGAVRALPDGALRDLTRRYTLGGADPATLEQLGQSARDLFSTLEHNIGSPVDLRLYDDEVVSASFDRAALPLFRRLLKQRGAAFLEDIEGWISEHEKQGSPDTTRAGVSVRMFIDDERDTRESEPNPNTK